MLTTAWDDTMLSTDNIDAMEIEHKARRSQASRFNRFPLWFLDRQFFKAIRKGETVNAAREEAIQRWGQLQGALTAAVALLFTVGAVLVIASAVDAGNYASAAISAFYWLVVFATFLKVGAWIGRALGKRHKEG